MNAQFYISESQGNLTLFARVGNDETLGSGFAGYKSLRFWDLVLKTSLDIHSAPTLLNLHANATIALRDTDICLQGFYTKSDWGFTCDIDDLTSKPLPICTKTYMVIACT